MLFAFVPLDGRLIPTPYGQTIEGATPKRLSARVKDGGWVFTPSPAVTETPAAVEGFRRLVERGEVAPHDAETAKALGVAYRPVEYVSASEGWRYARPPVITRSTASARRADHNQE
jgi:hypothetical protein